MRPPPVFLLDTDHLGIIQDRVQPEFQRLLDRIGQFPATAFYVSIVSFHERVRIGTMDLRIASIALARGFTVLTRNLVDFERVPGLAVEDWTRS